MIIKNNNNNNNTGIHEVCKTTTLHWAASTSNSVRTYCMVHHNINNRVNEIVRAATSSSSAP